MSRAALFCPLFGLVIAAACASPDRVTGKNPGGSLVIRSENDTTATTDTLVVGDKPWLAVQGADTTASVSWEVSDTSVISIVYRYYSRVQVSAVRAGSAIVTASYEGKTGTFQIVVRESIASDTTLARIQITTPLSDTATVGDSVPFGFNLWNGQGEPMFGVPFSLSLSDSALAHAVQIGNEHGYWIHTFKSGRLTITVRAADKTASAEILIQDGTPAPPGYEVIDLGTLGGNVAVPLALNDKGQVVGYSTTADGVEHAFLWQDGSMRDLNVSSGWNIAEVITNSGLVAGVLGGQAFRWNDGVTTVLGSVNDATIVGITADRVAIGTRDSEHAPTSAVWENGVWQQLTSFGYGGFSVARAMNRTGQIVGGAPVREIAGDKIFHPFIWQAGVMRDLGLLNDFVCGDDSTKYCGYAWAVDINGSGDVVGSGSGEGGHSHGLLWSRGGTVRDLGPGTAVAINEAGEIVGDALWSDGGDAFFWRQGSRTILPSLGSHRTVVVDLNDSSMVTGSSRTAQGKSHVFLWTPERGIVDLGTGPSAAEAQAVAINARGDIVGYSCTTDCWSWDTMRRAILWRKKG